MSFDWFGLFKKKPEPQPVPAPVVSLPAKIVINDAIKFAMSLTSSFEGNNGFGNAIGNFDGQGLTCGALGFAWGQGLHQKIVLDAVKHNGLLAAKMPRYGKDYHLLAALPIAESLPKISLWSDGRGILFPELAKELKQFWSCQEMTGLQIKQATAIGQHAYRDASLWSQEYRRLVSPTLHEFCFFFDVVVQNGSIGLSFKDVMNKVAGGLERAMDEVIGWAHWYKISDNKFLNKDDTGNNSELWKKSGAFATEEQKLLLVLAYIRALKGQARYQGNVLNRKGTIAMKGGYVNRSLYTPVIPEVIVL